jgi:murein DD-endopeptidase MepM/ murein hydrolase activator NlpD
MKTCFKSPMKITQKFGNDLIVNGKHYYAQWGMKSHNGIDAVPSIPGEDTIISFYSGKIVQILINHPDYGNALRILVDGLNIVECHNHLKSIETSIKLFWNVGVGTPLGVMGNTGASMGAHDHIAFMRVDKTCFDEKGNLINRLNRDNGWLGYIDGTPYIQ